MIEIFLSAYSYGLIYGGDWGLSGSFLILPRKCGLKLLMQVILKKDHISHCNPTTNLSQKEKYSRRTDPEVWKGIFKELKHRLIN